MFRVIAFIFLATCFLALWLYNPLISYFSQDDFFHLRVIQQNSIKDIPDFYMGMSEEYGFFRPLSRETYNLVMFKAFNLNPLPYHAVNLLLIIVIAYIIFLLMKKLTSLAPAVLTSVLYMTSSVHAIELYYLGSVQQLLATMFLSISALFFLKHLREQSLNSYLISFLSFLLALLCHDMAIVAPGILFLVYFFHLQNKNIPFNGMFLRLLPFAILALLHLQFILYTSLPRQQTYTPSINLKSVVNNLVWYILWSFGLPESLVDFVGPGLKINKDFLKWFGNYSIIVFSSFVLMIFALVLGFVFQKGKSLRSRNIFLFISLFVISLSPFLLFPQHKFVYYLSFALVWFSAALSFVLSSFLSSTRVLQFLAVLIIFSYLLISYQTTRFYEITYWAAKRAAAAKVILQDLKRFHPEIDTNTIFYILDDPEYPEIAKEWGTSSRQAFYILSGPDAFKLFYNDSSVKVYYQGVLGLPKAVDKNKVINFMAKFPY